MNIFTAEKILLYIAWACLRNDLPFIDGNFPRRLIMGKFRDSPSAFNFCQIFFFHRMNEENNKLSVEFDFGPDLTFHFGVTCP